MHIAQILIGIALVLFGLMGWVILPLERIFRYFALLDPRFAPASRLLASIRIDEEDVAARNGFTVEGSAGCLGFFALPAGLWLLPNGNLLLALLCLGFFSYLALSYVAALRAATIATAKRADPSYGTKVSASCTICRAPMRLENGQTRTVICPACGAASWARTAPIGWPAWIYSTLLVGIWLIGVNPWKETGASAATVLAWSLLTLAAAHLIPVVVDIIQKDREARRIDFKILKELQLVFLIVFATSLFLTLLEYSLKKTSNADLRGTVVQQILAIQFFLTSLSTFLNKARLGFWISVVTFFSAAILMIVAEEWVAPVLAIRKRVSKILKIVTVICLAMGSFSLVGIAAGKHVEESLRSTEFALSSKGDVAVEKLRDSIALALIRQVAEDSLDKTALVAECRDARQAAPCPDELSSALAAEIQRANELNGSWANGETPDHIAAVTEARAASATWTKPEVNRSHRATSPNLEPAFADLSIVDVEKAQVAIQIREANRYEPSTLKDLVGVGVDVVADMLPWKLKAPLGDKPNPIAKKLTEVVTNAAVAPVNDLVRDAVVRIVKGCKRACAANAEKLLNEASSRPAARVLGHQIATATSTAYIDLAARYTTLRRANDRMDERRQAISATALRSEKAGPWGEARQRLAEKGDHSSASEKDISSRRALARSWRDEALQLALASGSAGKSEPSGGWDRAFLTFLAADRRRPEIFGAFVADNPDLARKLTATDVGLSSEPRNSDKDAAEVLRALSKAAYPDGHAPPVVQSSVADFTTRTHAETLPPHPHPPPPPPHLVKGSSPRVR